MNNRKKIAFSRCSECAAPSYVIDTRDTGDYIRRRRKCSRTTCGHRWTTREDNVDRPDYAKKDKDIMIIEAIEKLKEALKP